MKTHATDATPVSAATRTEAGKRIELSEAERSALPLDESTAAELCLWRERAAAIKKVGLGLRRLRAAQKQQGYPGLNLSDAERILDRETLRELHAMGKVRMCREAPPYVVYVY